MYIEDLVGEHGATRESLEPFLTPFEGMQSIELPNSVTFEYRNNENPNLAPVLYLKPDPKDSALREYVVDPEGYTKAMRLAGFPESIVKNYPTPLMVEPLNYGFRNRVGEKVKAFVRDGNLVAFVKPTLELISVRELVDKMYNVAGGADKVLFERIDHKLAYTQVSMILPLRDREWVDERIASGGHKRVNDVVCGGINFQASIMGEKPIEVSGYLYRLVCSNGLISAETKFKWSRKTESQPLVDWFGERVLACMEGLTHELDKVDNLIKLPIAEGSRARVLDGVFREYEMSDRMRQGVLERLADAPPRNMWDVTNAITNVANDEEYSENPLTIRRLQTIGGHMSTKLHVCDSCHAVSSD